MKTPVNFVKFLKTLFLQNTSGCLLLITYSSKKKDHIVMSLSTCCKNTDESLNESRRVQTNVDEYRRVTRRM